jgi:hypothetical protein
MQNQNNEILIHGIYFVCKTCKCKSNSSFIEYDIFNHWSKISSEIHDIWYTESSARESVDKQT